MKHFLLLLVCLFGISVASRAAAINVVDANGVKVGAYYFDDLVPGDVTVARFIVGNWFQIPIQWDTGFSAGFGSSVAVQFSQPDCAGAAYMPQPVPFTPMIFAVTDEGGTAVLIGQTLYWPKIATRAASQQICSQDNGSGCQNLICGNVDALLPARTYDLTQLGLVPPFHLQ